MTQFKEQAIQTIRIEGHYFEKSRKNAQVIITDIKNLEEEAAQYEQILQIRGVGGETKTILKSMESWEESIEVYTGVLSQIIGEELLQLKAALIEEWTEQLQHIQRTLAELEGRYDTRSSYIKAPNYKQIGEKIAHLSKNQQDRNIATELKHLIAQVAQTFKRIENALALEHSIAQKQQQTLQRKLSNEYMKKNATKWKVIFETALHQIFIGKNKVHTKSYDKDKLEQVFVGIEFTCNATSIMRKVNINNRFGTKDMMFIGISIEYNSSNDQFIFVINKNWEEGAGKFQKIIYFLNQDSHIQGPSERGGVYVGEEDVCIKEIIKKFREFAYNLSLI